MSGSEEKPLPIRPLQTTLRSVEGQPSAFNPFHVYKAFSGNMLDQVSNGKFNLNVSFLYTSKRKWLVFEYLLISLFSLKQKTLYLFIWSAKIDFEKLFYLLPIC